MLAAGLALTSVRVADITPAETKGHRRKRFIYGPDRDELDCYEFVTALAVGI